MIHVKWTGAAGLELTYKGQSLLIDPYYTRSGKWDVFFKRVTPDAFLIKTVAERSGRIAAIVVSHTHFDHALDIPEFIKYTQGPLIGSASLETLMDSGGIAHRVSVCEGGETVEIADDIHITMLPSTHGLVAFGRVPFQGEIKTPEQWPMKASEYRVGQVFSPKITIGETVFLHVGSAGFNETALLGHPCDVLFLCVPGWKKTSGYPEKIIELTRPKTVVLFHYDNFFMPIQKKGPIKSFPFLDIAGLKKRIHACDPNITILAPDLFKTMVF